MTRIFVPALAMMALVGFCNQTNAQAPCLELTRLRSEVVEASKEVMDVPTPARCEAYIRFSTAWNEVARYANENRELCAISLSSLGEFEKRHREAVVARDNVCAGRPPRPFPADIILR